MRILITGATGFLGRHLLTELAPHHELVALSRRTPGPELEGLADWVPCDLSSLDVSVLPGRVDAVIHLAQSHRYREFPEGAEDMYGVNVGSTFALLEYARAAAAGTFILASTGGVYKRSATPVREGDALQPTSFYFRSKLAAEILTEGYAEYMRTLALRFFFIYGPGQRRMLIPTLAEKVAAGEEIVIEGDPGVRINPIYVEDATRVFTPALELPVAGTLNVAGEEDLTISELVERIGDVAGERPQVRHVPAVLGGDLVADCSRMREELGIRPQVGLADGLRRLVHTAVSSSAHRSPTAS